MTIEGLKITILGSELKEKILEKASRHKQQALELQFQNPNAELAALWSYIADHIEEDEAYRLPIDQVINLELHKERI